MLLRDALLSLAHKCLNGLGGLGNFSFREVIKFD